jgi:hypothetical protein
MGKKMSTETFIERSIKIHNNEYDYSKTDLEHRDEKGRVCVICPKHGEFWVKPSHHLDGHKCKRCISSKPRRRKDGSNSMGLEEFIKRARKVHGDKYDYSSTNYINSSTDVCIICPIHGEFNQIPDNHLRGKGCRECGFESSHKKQRKTTEQFILECKSLYGDLFDYSKSVYQGNKKDVIVKCNKCGKEFKITPHNHLVHKEGCPFCKLSKLEKNVEKVLLDNGIEYEQQKVFEWLIDGKKIKRFDFYLPHYNTVIECQGLQHFKPIKYFGGQKHFEIQRNNDELKIKLCQEHGIKLLHYSEFNIEYPYKVFTNIKDLINEIKASESDN